MKTIFPALMTIALIVFGCKQKAETKSTDTMAEQNKDEELNHNDLVVFGENYAAAWSGQEPAKVAEFYAEDASLTVNDGEPAIGTVAITNVAKGFMDAFPDLVVIMDSLIVESGKTQFHWTLIGTNTGPEGTGNQVHISGYEEWTLNKDGLVQESKGNFDQEDYNRQLEGIE